MTLRQWTRDMFSIVTDKVGVKTPTFDPAPDYYKRKNIIDKVIYLRDTSRDRGSIYGYNITFNELQNFAIPLSDIKMNLESHIAAAKIKEKEARATRGMDDALYYQNSIKALDNILKFVEDNMMGEEKRLYSKG